MKFKSTFEVMKGIESLFSLTGKSKKFVSTEVTDYLTPFFRLFDIETRDLQNEYQEELFKISKNYTKEDLNNEDYKAKYELEKAEAAHSLMSKWVMEKDFDLEDNVFEWVSKQIRKDIKDYTCDGKIPLNLISKILSTFIVVEISKTDKK